MLKQIWVQHRMNTIIGLMVILLGVCLAAYNLFPIYKFSASHNWPTTTGSVSNIIDTGMLFRLRRIITFIYSVDGKSYTSAQMMPKDSWVQGLKNGSPIQIRYCSNKPESALVNRSATWGYVFLACWNSIWIIVGLSFIFKH